MRLVRLIVFALALVFALLISGCTAEEPAVVSYWPVVDKERTVPKPPEPIRWPLTGVEAPSADAIRQRVVSVKIENSSAARPQTGLQAADVVYESVAEGGITRFNAIFHSQAPETVGPVRSARLSDTSIVPQYKALFAFSGASGSVNSAVRAAKLESLSEDAGVTKPYTRSSARPRPHNLYGTVPGFRAEGERRGYAKTADLTGFAFDRRSTESTPTVTQMTIPFSNANTVAWTYAPEDRSYRRVNNGKVFTDAATGEQIRARNVVVLWAKHTAISRDKVGSPTYEITLTGSGRMTLFRDGQSFDGTWEAQKGAPPSFKSADGSVVKLAVGNTWFQVINTSINITVK
jgi:hypothetical protein